MYTVKFLFLSLVFMVSCAREASCDHSDDSIDFSLTKDEIVANYEAALIDSPKISIVMELCANKQVSKLPIQVQSYISTKSKNLYLLINHKGQMLLDLTPLDSVQQIEFALKESLQDSAHSQFSILPIWDKQTGHDVVKSVFIQLDAAIRKNHSYDSIDIVFNKPKDIPPPPPIN